MLLDSEQFASLASEAVVPTLVAYAGRVRDVRAETAAEQAVADRQHRGQTEVLFEPARGFVLA